MARNLFSDYIASKSAPIEVRSAIIDRTTTSGMTDRAVSILEAAVAAAAAAGLARIDVVAAKGGGHRSHAAGSEWDIRGFNADGSRWTNAQRVAVAEGAKRAGSDRFGIYNMTSGLGRGTLHLGYSGPGRPAAVWGANGLLSGPASRRFTDPFEAMFAKGQPIGAIPFAEVARQTGVAADVPTPRARPELVTAAAYVLQSNGLIRKGADREAVQDLQRYLNSRGITDDKGRKLEVDGRFGASTRQAVKNYQEEVRGLKADGIVGPRTMAAMLREQNVAAAEARTRVKDDVVTPAIGAIDPLTGLPVNAGVDPAGALAGMTGINIAAGNASFGIDPSRAMRELDELQRTVDFGPPTGIDTLYRSMLTTLPYDEPTRMYMDRWTGGGFAAGAPAFTAPDDELYAGYDLDALDVSNALSPHLSPVSAYASPTPIDFPAGAEGSSFLNREQGLLYAATAGYAVQAREQAQQAAFTSNESSSAFEVNSPWNNMGFVFEGQGSDPFAGGGYSYNATEGFTAFSDPFGMGSYNDSTEASPGGSSGGSYAGSPSGTTGFEGSPEMGGQSGGGSYGGGAGPGGGGSTDMELA